ncbi:MAG: hypothetical protein ACRYGP_13700 [Janthinobacterium lividum]
MECIALVRCGNCMRKTGISFDAPAVEGRVPRRLLVEEAARRMDAFVCGECDCGSPNLVALSQITHEPAAEVAA